MGDQLQQVVSGPDQRAVIAHPSTLADIERNKNILSRVRHSRGSLAINPLMQSQKGTFLIQYVVKGNCCRGVDCKQ
jgi:hypothetical protein